jgi:site-specific DNA-methyltransferase (adenine-specific)
MSGTIHLNDSLTVLQGMPDESVSLVYVDPPFGTQHIQRLRSLSSTQASTGTAGFGGRKYTHVQVSDMAYSDVHVDYIHDFLAPLLVETKRVLTKNGTLYLHMDWREVHYAKCYLDTLFGRDNLLNCLVWSYNWGGRGRNRFPRKHDDILVYVKDPKNYVFNWDDIDRIPYGSPELQKDPARAARGQVPTDVWCMQIIGTGSRERTGYPTQKPIRLVERIIKASSNPGDTVLDFCAGSGTTGVAAHNLGRNFVLIDNNSTAIDVMKKRFGELNITNVTFV